MNYRHAFHAGNFADAFKHAVFLAWLRALTASGAPPLELIDTHAGGGVYDLSAAPASRSAEAAEGIGRILPDPPEALRPLAAAVRSLNGEADGRLYPGSAWLAMRTLRAGDRYLGCELRDEVRADLEAVIRRHAGEAAAIAQAGDGYAAAITAPAGPRRALLIDPPFERGDEARNVLGALSAAVRRGEAAAVWLPLKDLDTYDRLLGQVEALRAPAAWAAQVRLRPLRDPLRLNGCAMVLVNGPDIEDALAAIGAAVAERCGEAGASASVERLAG